MAAAAASKKESTSLSLFMVVFGLEVEEELSTMGTRVEQKEFGLVNGIQSKKKRGESRSLRFRHMRGLPGAVLCEPLDLGS